MHKSRPSGLFFCMPKKPKKIELPELKTVHCKGFQVIVEPLGGGMWAIDNCKLDEWGKCAEYVSPFSGEVVPAEKVQRDHQWRCEDWQYKFDAVGQWLAAGKETNMSHEAFR